jgi:hypothetical protein
MARKRYGEDEETRHTISANILEAIGRGLMIATAGLVLGAILGTSSAAARFGAGALVASGVIGAGCMIGSALVRNAGCRSRAQEVDEPSETVEITAFMAMHPLLLQQETEGPGEQPARYVERLRQERQEELEAGRRV